MKVPLSQKRERAELESLALDLPNAIRDAKRLGMPLTKLDLVETQSKIARNSHDQFIYLAEKVKAAPLYPAFIQSFASDDRISRALRKRFFNNIRDLIGEMSQLIDSDDWLWPEDTRTPWIATHDYQACPYIRLLAQIRASMAADEVLSGEFDNGLVLFQECYGLIYKTSPGLNWLDCLLIGRVHFILLLMISRCIPVLKSERECEALVSLITRNPPPEWNQFLKGEVIYGTTLMTDSSILDIGSSNFITEFICLPKIRISLIKRRCMHYETELLQKAGLNHFIRFWMFVYAPGFSELSPEDQYRIFTDNIENHNSKVGRLLFGLFEYKRRCLDEVVQASKGFSIRQCAISTAILVKREKLKLGSYPAALDQFFAEVDNLETLCDAETLRYSTDRGGAVLNWTCKSFRVKDAVTVSESVTFMK